MAKKAKKIQKKATPVKATKISENAYRAQLMKLGRQMVEQVRSQVLPYLKSQQSNFVIDTISSDLRGIFNRLNSRFTGSIVASFAEESAQKAVLNLNRRNQKKFTTSVNKASGVDLGVVIQNEDLSDFLDLSIQNNVQLIKTLPEEYLKAVQTIVNQGVASGARFSTIAKQISAKTGSANSKLANRIKLIATDQMQTVNAQLTIRRSENLGIKKGIYQTSEDERVRPCHAELNGKEFILSKGAWSKTCKKFIIPGVTDINCRCTYNPIIELDKLGVN